MPSHAFYSSFTRIISNSALFDWWGSEERQNPSLFSRFGGRGVVVVSDFSQLPVFTFAALSGDVLSARVYWCTSCGCPALPAAGLARGGMREVGQERCWSPLSTQKHIANSGLSSFLERDSKSFQPDKDTWNWRDSYWVTRPWFVVSNICLMLFTTELYLAKLTYKVLS